NTLTNEFTHTGELPVGSKDHQFSYLVGQDQNIDPVLSYRFLSLSQPSAYLAHRFGVIVPLENERYGFEFKQAFTNVLSDRWMAHWNFGFHRVHFNSYNAGSSLVYYAQDKL